MGLPWVYHGFSVVFFPLELIHHRDPGDAWNGWEMAVKRQGKRWEDGRETDGKIGEKGCGMREKWQFV